MPWLADIPAVAPSRKLNYEEKQAVLSFARRYPLLGQARADEIAGIWTGKLRGCESPGLEAESSDSAADTSAADTSASAYLLGIAHNLGG